MRGSEVSLVVCALALVACGSDDDPGNKSDGTGGQTATGGATSSGGKASSGGKSSSGGTTTGGSSGGTPTTGEPQGPGSGLCDLEEPAFCDTFDKASPGGRGGDLDETKWSVARGSHKVNPSQGETVAWPKVSMSACGKVTEVFPSDDVVFCKNPTSGKSQFTSVFDDVEGPVFQSFRVLQPFDFAERVGRISVDIDAKTQTPEGHGWWWEIVIADEPVPVPYQEFISHALMARKAVVLEFEGISSFDGTTNELSHVFVEDGYKYVREFNREQAKYESFKTKEEVLNHIEILINKDFLEVWATDLDDKSTFRRVARVENLGLTFTRGYVNLQHSQYNASKAELDGFTTYHIGQLGFDGPVLKTPRSYQVPDALEPGPNANIKNLGYELGDDKSGETKSFSVDGVDLADAAEARLNLNAWYFVEGRSIQFRFNGGTWRTFEHPYPESAEQTRAVTMPVDLADLVAGKNTFELRSSGGETLSMVVANVELEVVPQ